MFKQRLLTALLLVPIVLLSLYYANAILLIVLVLMVVSKAGWEWSALIPIHSAPYKILFVVSILSLAIVNFLWFDVSIIICLCWWVLCALAILTFPASKFIWGHRSVLYVSALCVLPLIVKAFSILYMQPMGKDLIVYLFCLVWGMDTGAYLAGKRWGRHKLIPRVSPGKTFEGLFGGLLLVMIVAFVGCFYFIPASYAMWFFIAASIAVVSVCGDLAISMFKRRCNLKDTGAIFPGHGGVLDRIDSLIAALPLFLFLLHFLSRD